MQSNDKKLEQLSPYDRFQIEKYGNVLLTAGTENEETEGDRLSTSEESYIFSSQNTAS